MWIIVGLGNPGEEYKNTRHNIGRDILSRVREAHGLPDFVKSREYHALISEGNICGEKALLLLPETFMNASGKSVQKAVKGSLKHELLVVYDDVDIPLGSLKISFNRGSGGHKGLESIINITGNREFGRIRVGICPVSPSGELKKPNAGEEFDRFVLGSWKPYEEDEVSRSIKLAQQAIETVITKGVQKGMDEYNTTTYGKNTPTK